LLKKLFELEVPEIAEGIVEIKAVAREPGHRSKIAVSSNEPAVDPVGACVGPKGSRVRNVVTELRGEKIDVVPWSADPATFVANALQPAKVREARVDPETQTALVIVPDYQLSLAIGREGQNARLAARLTGWRIDIKSETQFSDEQRGGPRPAQPAAAAEPSPSSAQLASEESGAAHAGDATDGGAGSGADSSAAAGGDSVATEAEPSATTRDDSAPAPADTEPSATEGADEPVVVADPVEGSAEEAAEEKAEA
jgi:N utilization substance protein A